MTKERFDTDKLQMSSADFDDIMRRALGIAPPVDDPKKRKPTVKRVQKPTSKITGGLKAED